MFCANCGSVVADDAKFCRQCGKSSGTAASQSYEAAYAPPRSRQMNPITADVYAGFWRRVLAYLIDYILLVIVIVLIGSIALGSGAKNSPLLGLAYLVLPLLYFVFLESSGMQGTLGKKALGIKVTDDSGNRVSGARAFGRYFAKIVSGLTLGIGFAMAGFTAKRQALHDMISGSLVVRSAFEASDIAQSPGDPRSGGYIAAMVILMVLFGPFSLGILAAIAIPAYQNYTIRAQITEGLMRADGWKTAVVDYYANAGKWPDSKDLGITTALGQYEQSMEVQSGAIVIVYGGQANSKISGKRLVLSPGANSNNDVIWVCGSASPPDGLALTVDSARYTTVAPQFLPSSCHK